MPEIDSDVGAAGARAALDARAAPEGRPDLPPRKSLVIDLAYAEFCERRARGEEVDPDEFCRQFPAHQSSLRHRLVMADWLGGVGDLIPAETAVVWPEPGDTFGDYRLLRVLGRGTFAVVYLATEGATGDRPVVLKVSLDDNAEARTLGRLEHENIVPVLSAGRHETGLSLVCMPFLGSATLHHVLDRAYSRPDSPPRHGRVLLEAVRAAAEPGDPPLEPSEPAPYLTGGSWSDAVAHLGERLASALDCAHRHGVIHRDLKPSNVLLDAAGRPRLLDFNLSQDERLDDRRVGGTLPYMAPEQLRAVASPAAERPAPDARSDLFSLGVLLYELLTGRRPFAEVSTEMPSQAQAELLLGYQRRGWVPVRQLNPRVDRRLATVVERCLAFDAKDRPASASELAEALRRRLVWPRRRRLLACALGALLALAGAGAVMYPRVAPAPPATVKASPAEEHKRGKELFAAGKYDEALTCFDRAVDAEPKNAAYKFARGRARLRLGDDVSGALGDFDFALAADRTDPRREEAVAYCQLLLSQFTLALHHLNAAEELGVATPALHNNRAYAYLNAGPEDRKKAKDALDKALEQAKDCLPARYNRALYALNLWFFEGGPGKNHPPLDAQARADIEAVINKHPTYAQLHLEAAQIYAAGSVSPEDDIAESGRRHVREAVHTFGWGKKHVAGNNFLARQLGTKDFTDWLNRDAAAGRPQPKVPPSLRLCDPIQNWLEE